MKTLPRVAATLLSVVLVALVGVWGASAAGVGRETVLVPFSAHGTSGDLAIGACVTASVEGTYVVERTAWRERLPGSSGVTVTAIDDLTANLAFTDGCDQGAPLTSLSDVRFVVAALPPGCAPELAGDTGQWFEDTAQLRCGGMTMPFSFDGLQDETSPDPGGMVTVNITSPSEGLSTGGFPWSAAGTPCAQLEVFGTLGYEQAAGSGLSGSFAIETGLPEGC